MRYRAGLIFIARNGSVRLDQDVKKTRLPRNQLTHAEEAFYVPDHLP